MHKNLSHRYPRERTDHIDIGNGTAITPSARMPSSSLRVQAKPNTQSSDRILVAFSKLGKYLISFLKPVATKPGADRLIDKLHCNPREEDHEGRKQQCDLNLLFSCGMCRLNPIRIDVHEWVMRHIKRIREPAADFAKPY